MHKIPVQQIMTADVITIHPEALVAEAAEIMGNLELRRMPVVDDDDCLVGIVTDSDIREAESIARSRNAYEPSAKSEWLTVGDVMSDEVVTITSDATVGQLASLLMEHKIGGVPIVEPDETSCNRQRLIGIVTETDIFRMIAEAWEKEEIGD